MVMVVVMVCGVVELVVFGFPVAACVDVCRSPRFATSHHFCLHAGDEASGLAATGSRPSRQWHSLGVYLGAHQTHYIIELYLFL